MKYLAINIFKAVINIIYFVFKCILPVSNKVVYLSRESDSPSLDVEMLSKEIEKLMPGCKQVYRFRMIHPGLKAKAQYGLGLIGDIYHLAGAKVAVCDTYSIAVSCLRHRKCLKVVQIWHSMGAIKKFSLQSLGTDEGRGEKISQAMNMHRNYDYVIAPSVETGKFYQEAFGVDESKIKILTLPHIDYIVDKEAGKKKKEEFLEVYPELIDKKLVLYVPTYRNNEDEIVESLAKCFKEQEDYKLLISLHPISKVSNKDEYKIKGGFTSFDLMKIADVIITDYSACAFEASMLSVPVYFYVPDISLYRESRGLNIDIQEQFPEFVYEDAKALYDVIVENLDKTNNMGYNFALLNDFRHRYVENENDCTAKMAQFIYELIKTDK